MGEDDLDEKMDVLDEDDGFYDNLSGGEDNEAEMINTCHVPKIISRTAEKWSKNKVSGVKLGSG